MLHKINMNSNNTYSEKCDIKKNPKHLLSYDHDALEGYCSDFPLHFYWNQVWQTTEINYSYKHKIHCFLYSKWIMKVWVWIKVWVQYCACIHRKKLCQVQWFPIALSLVWGTCKRQVKKIKSGQESLIYHDWLFLVGVDK